MGTRSKTKKGVIMPRLNLETMFYNNMTDCPWYDNTTGNCIGSKNITEHITLKECDYYTCPIFHWIEILADQIKDK